MHFSLVKIVLMSRRRAPPIAPDRPLCCCPQSPRIAESNNPSNQSLKCSLSFSTYGGFCTPKQIVFFTGVNLPVTWHGFSNTNDVTRCRPIAWAGVPLFILGQMRWELIWKNWVTLYVNKKTNINDMHSFSDAPVWKSRITVYLNGQDLYLFSFSIKNK